MELASIQLLQGAFIIKNNTKHTQAMTVSTKQYLQEQMRKAAGWLEDVFMQPGPVEGN